MTARGRESNSCASTYSVHYLIQKASPFLYLVVRTVRRWVAGRLESEGWSTAPVLLDVERHWHGHRSGPSGADGDTGRICPDGQAAS